MSESPRVHRVADIIQAEITDILRRRMKDPRLGFLTVTDVTVTRDLRQATVYVSALTEEELAASLELLDGVVADYPWSGHVKVVRAAHRYAVDRHGDAVADLDQAIGQVPELELYRPNLVLALIHAGAHDAAEEQLELMREARDDHRVVDALAHRVRAARARATNAS